jgi:hypothetical protein
VVDATSKASKEQFLPFLKASIENFGPLAMALEITNVGKGPAKDVTVEFKVQEFDDTTRVWTRTLLSPNDSQRFLIPKNKTETEYEVQFFQNNNVTLALRIEYYDVFDDKKSHTELIDVSSYARQLGAVAALFLEKPMDKIANNTDRITSDLSVMKWDIDKMEHHLNSISKSMQKLRSPDADNPSR